MTGALSFLIKQIRCNFLYFLFYVGGIILFLSAVFTCIHYCGEIDSLIDPDFLSGTNIEIELTQNCDLDRLARSDVTIYAQGDSETYNIDIVFDDNKIHISDFQGGAAVYSLPENNQFFSDYQEIQGNYIWLINELGNYFGCNVGDEVKIVNDETFKYIIKGFYDDSEVSSLFSFRPSFIVMGGEKSQYSTIKALLPNAESLMNFSDFLRKGDYIDSDGYIGMCKSFKTIKTLFIVLCCVLSVALFVFVLTAIATYIHGKSSLFDHLYVLGITRLRLIAFLTLLFAAVSIVASVVALGLSFWFKSIIDGWALKILNVTLAGNFIIEIFLIGIPILLMIIISIIAILVPKEIKL